MYTPDEVAGIVDLFGALTRQEAATALSELAYRTGDETASPEDAIDEALKAFALVELDDDVVAPGPVAFPTLPAGAEDLPHMLETDGRRVARASIVEAAADRLRTEAACAATIGAGDRAETLLEVSYDLEAWGGPDLSGIRARLDPVRDGTNY